MALDLSGVTTVVQDTLRAADEYSSHDPKLATELSLRACEICHEFDIDLASLGKRGEAAPESLAAEPLPIPVPAGSLTGSQARRHQKLDEDQLDHILDLQRKLVDEEFVVDGLRQNPKPRSIWSVLNPLIRPQST